MPQGDEITWDHVPESPDAEPSTLRLHEFNRRESPTQTVADARLQALSGEIWGLPGRQSDIASVKAYREATARLADHGQRGVMFSTAVLPTPGGGSLYEARWYEGSPGVVHKSGAFVAIPINGFLNLQPQRGEP